LLGASIKDCELEAQTVKDQCDLEAQAGTIHYRTRVQKALWKKQREEKKRVLEGVALHR